MSNKRKTHSPRTVRLQNGTKELHLCPACEQDVRANTSHHNGEQTLDHLMLGRFLGRELREEDRERRTDRQ